MPKITNVLKTTKALKTTKTLKGETAKFKFTGPEWHREPSADQREFIRASQRRGKNVTTLMKRRKKRRDETAHAQPNEAAFAQ